MNFYTNVYYTGSNILLRQNTNGKSEKVRTQFSPTLYLISSKNTELKTIDNRNLEPIQFLNIQELNDFRKTYENVDNFEIHGDIGIEYQYINKEFGVECQYDFRSIGVLYIDIETECENGFPDIDTANEKVIAITCKYKGRKTVFCLGEFEWNEDTVDVNCYEDEQQMLRDFIEYMAITQPDIITGWNVRFFDIPYLKNRCSKLLENKDVSRLSPWGIIREKMVEKAGKEYKVFDLVGISTLDYYELYKTFTYTNQESYKLDHIAYVELGERKISYSEYDHISEFYRKNFQKFVEYNMKDVELVERLEEKLKLMELAVALAYSAGVNFTDVFSQVRTWDVIIYNSLKNKNIIIPPKKNNVKDEQYAGAYVKDPIIGMHDWVVSYDVNSLYPSLIIHYNISPETLAKKNFKGKIKINDILDKNENSETHKYLKQAKELDYSIAANGTMYRRDQRGFLPALMDKMYEERKMYKKKIIEAKKKLEEVNNEMKKRGLIR